jgi:hypothetical protein
MTTLFALACVIFFNAGFAPNCDGKAVKVSPEQPSAVRTLAKASDDLAGGIKLTISTKRQLARERLLDRDEERMLTNLMLDVNRSGKEYNRVLTSIERDTSQSRAALRNALDEVAKSIARLNDEGVLHIKSEAARQRAGLPINGVRAAIAAIGNTLRETPLPTPSPGPLPSPAGGKEAASFGRGGLRHVI